MKDEKKRKAHKKKINRPYHKRVHNYFNRTGFYLFIWGSIKKAIIPIILIVIAVYIFKDNIENALHKMTETLPTLGIFSFFYSSETILGLVPPEIFIGWAGKTTTPYLNVTILATLSYLGGLTAYFIGRASLKITAVREYLEVKMARNLKNTQKWGGILILVGALLPLPFAISCLTTGMIKYPFKNVVGYGLFRFIRFAIYTYLIFSAMKII